MKTFPAMLSTVLFFITSATFASGNPVVTQPWQNLNPDDQVTLTQTLQLPKRGGGAILLRAGDHFVLADLTGMEGVDVARFIFKSPTCGNVDAATADIQIVRARGVPRNRKAEVGVEFLPNCELNVYVEAKDMGTVSFFR